MRKQHVLYHGTSWETAQIIKNQGFKASSGGCLGGGTDVARADKASKFAANCPRHGGPSGAVIKVRITFTNAKYTNYNDQSWQSEGYDACRAEKTSASPHPEWCLKRAEQVEVLEIRPIACGEELPAFEGEALSLGAVRQCASTIGLSEVYFNEQLGVVSFATDASDSQSPRLNVYYATGTVIDHRTQHDVPRVRRKMDMHQLASVFQELSNKPYQPSDGCHCHQRKRPAHESPRSHQWVNRHGAVGAEEHEASAVLGMLREEVAKAEAVLEDHKQRREEQARREAAERRLEQERLQKEEEERQKRAAEAAAQAAREEQERHQQAERARIQALEDEKRRRQDNRGTTCGYWLANSHATEELSKRHQTLKSVTHLTLLGDGFFLARENGDSFWSNLPSNLSARLVENDLNTKGVMKYAAAGPHGQYYADVGNHVWWSGSCSESFDKVAQARRSISRVAFGDNHSWIVIFADGGSAWEGIPQGLHDSIKGKKYKGSPEEVTLGPNATWFVRYTSGAYDYSLPTHVHEKVDEYKGKSYRKKIRNVILNSTNNDWIIRCS